MRSLQLLFFTLVFCTSDFGYALDNGLALTPPRGWSTWCSEGPCGNDYCSEVDVKAVAMAMINNGLRDTFGSWIIFDDCWAAGTRAANGSLQWDSDRFPSGIPSLTQWLHSHGFQLGLYTSAGNVTCSSGGRPYPIPGSENFYEQDAATFATWDVDYVKLDWCGDVKDLPLDGIAVGAKDYKAFSQAMMNQVSTKPMVFEGVAAAIFLLWDVATYVNVWRASTDHHDAWTNTMEVIATVMVADVPGRPGGWGYLDVLMTGGQGCAGTKASVHCPGMTDTEYITEFTLWSLYQSPLVVATDVRNMTAIMTKVLLNTDILSLHNDTRTPPGKFLTDDTTSCPSSLGLSCLLFGRSLYDGSVLVAFFNAGDTAVPSMKIDFDVIGSKLNRTWSNATTVNKVFDLWTKNTTIGRQSTGHYTWDGTPIEGHGVRLLRLWPTQQ